MEFKLGLRNFVVGWEVVYGLYIWSVFLYIMIPIDVDPDFRIGTVSTGNGMTGVEIS